MIDLTGLTNDALLEAAAGSRDLLEACRQEGWRRMRKTGVKALTSDQHSMVLKEQAPHTILADNWISVTTTKKEAKHAHSSASSVSH